MLFYWILVGFRWFDSFWFVLDCYDSIWVVLCCICVHLVSFDLICVDFNGCCLVWFDLIGFDLIWFDLIWFDLRRSCPGGTSGLSGRHLGATWEESGRLRWPWRSIWDPGINQEACCAGGQRQRVTYHPEVRKAYGHLKQKAKQGKQSRQAKQAKWSKQAKQSKQARQSR